MTAPIARAVAAAPPGGARGAAFDLEGGPDAALLLHGLTGSPFEVRHVAERLQQDGLRCLGPVLPGHGGSPEALAPVAWRDWVEGARRDLARLDGARRVFLVGCSMGALVACALAAARPGRVAGLALLAPALQLSGAARVAGAVARALPFGRRLPPVPKLGGSDVRDPVARRDNPAMAAVPLSAVGELLALAREVERLLPAVRAPALVVAGGQDHTVAMEGARRLAARVGSGPARLLVLQESFHLVGIDVERDRCAGEVAAFFSSIPPSAAEGTSP
ncbi:alpha/beta hydrolase [Anaeromyxobacter diazotrophicus]|uniref:Carboxylesterase n=1 Tax=Anaeromyxobacter diazotrophicus TaxID=2590199 RepID=A0A7I9VRQ9_9BACT|nr:alpha/beta fold hydrolase [Anaeromyxobacter diazotrophicus]GEJ59113.1 carboxylesterase [Anaeromyxobacter diazotrophicus]